MHKKQSGAVEACWAHNPEVRRSKLRSARIKLFRVDKMMMRDHTLYVVAAGPPFRQHALNRKCIVRSDYYSSRISPQPRPAMQRARRVPARGACQRLHPPDQPRLPRGVQADPGVRVLHAPRDRTVLRTVANVSNHQRGELSRMCQRYSI